MSQIHAWVPRRDFGNCFRLLFTQLKVEIIAIENLLSIPLSHITHFQGSKPESLHILPIVFVIYLVYHGRPKSSSTYCLAFIIRINKVTGVCIIALIDHYINVLLRGNITNRLLSTERPLLLLYYCQQRDRLTCSWFRSHTNIHLLVLQS